jgi:hypothetical protein
MSPRQRARSCTPLSYATPCWGHLTGSGVAERRAVNDADTIIVRYTDGGHAPANGSEPDKCTCRDFVGVRTTAPASCGWRQSLMAGVQDDSSGSKTMTARAASGASRF